MKTLIIGHGQIGSALYSIVKEHHESYIKDKEDLDISGIECLQICYPDSDSFVQITKDYISKYKPSLVIVNSSIGVGKTEEIGEKIVYSPMRGRHPKLEQDMRIYTKFVFCKDVDNRERAAMYFENCNIRVQTHFNPSAGELLKLISNVHMGVEIAWRQEVERLLKHFDVDSLIFEDWEETYRNGYIKSEDFNLIRPSMRPDPIGGHCILPCTEILSKQFPSKIFDFVVESNEKSKGEIKWN